MGAGGFEFSDEAHDAATEVSVEDDGGDTNNETNGGCDEGFPDSFCELELFEAFVFSLSEFDEGFDHADDGAEESDHGGDSGDVGKVADALVHDPGLAGALCFGDFTDVGLGCGRVFRHEVDHFLGDSGDGFRAEGGISNDAHVVALADHRLRVVHEFICDDGSSAEGEEVEKDKNEGEGGENAEGDHGIATFIEEIDDVEFIGRNRFCCARECGQEKKKQERKEGLHLLEWDINWRKRGRKCGDLGEFQDIGRKNTAWWWGSRGWFLG